MCQTIEMQRVKQLKCNVSNSCNATYQTVVIQRVKQLKYNDQARHTTLHCTRLVSSKHVRLQWVGI